MPHLRSVDKGTFLLLRQSVTSPMRANCMVKFLLLKSLKFRSFQGLGHLGLDPNDGRKTAPRPHAFDKKHP